MKIIDAHMHLVEVIAGIGSQGELHHTKNGFARYATGSEFAMIPKELGTDSVSAEQLIALMDQHQIEKAVLLQGNYYGMQNLATMEAIKKYPHRFTGAASFDPFSRNKDKIITHLFDTLGFKIIKMELSTGSGLMANHSVVSLYDPIMTEIFEMANAKKLTFVLDLGRAGNCSYQISKVAEIVQRYPRMNFVICHLTAPQADDRHILRYNLNLLKQTNVYFDIAALHRNTKTATDPFAKALSFIKEAINIIGSSHLMFGTDVPSTMCHNTYQEMIDLILKSDLSIKDKENILYHTANTVYFSA